MRVKRHLLRSAFLAAVLAAQPAAALPLLQPHRAVYDLSLDKASDSSGITGITGRMVYQFDGSACDGYTVRFRFVTQIDTSDNSRLTDQQTTTFEDAQGKSFSFATKSFIDRQLDKEVEGTATKGPNGVTVELDSPREDTVKLAPTQFPTEHLEELIGKAEKGQTFYETNLFDGSEDADRVMTTSVVVGKPAFAAKDDPELPVLDKLAADKYWPVDIAYFDESSRSEGEELPQYRISFKLHANGVTRDLIMDYGDFSITGRLVDLALFDRAPQKACNR